MCALNRGKIFRQAKCVRYTCTNKKCSDSAFFFNLELFQLRNNILLEKILLIWFINIQMFVVKSSYEIKWYKKSFLSLKKYIVINMLLVGIIYYIYIYINYTYWTKIPCGNIDLEKKIATTKSTVQLHVLKIRQHAIFTMWM